MRTPTSVRGLSPRNSWNFLRARSVTVMVRVASNFAVPATAAGAVAGVGGVVVAMDSAMDAFETGDVDEGWRGGCASGNHEFHEFHEADLASRSRIARGNH